MNLGFFFYELLKVHNPKEKFAIHTKYQSNKLYQVKHFNWRQFAAIHLNLRGRRFRKFYLSVLIFLKDDSRIKLFK